MTTQQNEIDSGSVVFFSPLRNAICKQVISGICHNYTIFPPDQFRANFDPRKVNSLKERIGDHAFYELEQFPCLIAEGNLTSILKARKTRFINYAASAEANMLYSYFATLWLQFDNAVTLDKMYYITGQDWNCVPLQISFCTAKAKFPMSEITIRNIELATNDYLKLDRIVSASAFQKSAVLNEKVAMMQKPGQVGMRGPDQFYQHPGVFRAFLLLNFARANSFIPVKIAFYAILLESLLLRRNTRDIQKTVSTRSANFVAQDTEEWKAIYKAINTLYKKRSNFVHGDNIVLSGVDFEQHLELVDNIARRIFVKIIADDDLIQIFNDKPQPQFDRLFHAKK